MNYFEERAYESELIKDKLIVYLVSGSGYDLISSNLVS